jgi:anti-sigma B factor antagonist
MEVGHMRVVDQSDVRVVELFGEHDLAAVPALRDMIDELLDSGSRIVVDLSQATFIDSAVVGTIVYGYSRAVSVAGHSVAVVVKPDSVPGTIWRVAAVSHVLPTFATCAEAIGSVTRQAD